MGNLCINTKKQSGERTTTNPRVHNLSERCQSKHTQTSQPPKLTQIQIFQSSQLTVILPFSNPCGFKRRKELFDKCLERVVRIAKNCENLVVITATLQYGNTVSWRKSFETGYIRLMYTAPDILWAKENLINLAIEWISAFKPSKYVAWIDADIEFDDPNWVNNTIQTFQKYDRGGIGTFIQLFSTATMLDHNDKPTQIVKSFASQYVNRAPYGNYNNTNQEYWHPGFAWAADLIILNILRKKGRYVFSIRDIGMLLVTYFLSGFICFFHSFRYIFSIHSI